MSRFNKTPEQQRMDRCIKKANARRPHEDILLWKVCDGTLGDVLNFWVCRELDEYGDVLVEAIVLVGPLGILDPEAAEQYCPDGQSPEPGPAERVQLLEAYAHAHAAIASGPDVSVEELRAGEALIAWHRGDDDAPKTLIALADLRSELKEMVQMHASFALDDIDFLIELGVLVAAVERGEPQAAMNCGLTVYTQRVPLRSSWERLLDLPI